MRTRSAKRGRPRVRNAIRTKSGKISQGQTERDRRQLETEGEIMETALLARQVVHQIPKKSAASQESGYVLGRIYLDNTLGKKRGIGRQRLEAGNRYSEDMARYHGLTGIPFPSPRAMEMFRIGGYDDEVSATRALMARQASDHAQALEGVLLKRSRQICTTVKNVCLLDMDEARGWPSHMMRYLVDGLDALIVFYGIEGLTFVVSADKNPQSQEIAR